MPEKKPLTGYPSIDKPWLKYFSDSEKNMTIPKGSMFDYLYERNSAYPHDIALEYYGRRISYQNLFRQIDKCCRNLTAMGVGKGDIVTVQAIPLPQVIVLIYALTRIGACGNMLYPDAKAADVISSMKKTGSHLLIVVDKLFSLYENDLPDNFGCPIILMNIADQMSLLSRLIASRKAAYEQNNRKLRTIRWNDFISGEGKVYEENHDGTVPAFMLRTGGTTGIPKETVLTNENFNAITEAAYRANTCARWIRQGTDVLLLPPFIAFGIGSGIHDALCFGLKTVITLDVSPAAVSKLFLKHKPNYIIAGTVQIEQMMNDLKENEVDLSYIEEICVGGEAINPTFEQNLRSFLTTHNCKVLPLKGYGLTETSATVTVERVDANGVGSVGIPFALCNMKAIDPETGKELPYNTPGEICLSGPGIMQGYYQNKEATDEVIKTVGGERWLHSGDIGFISEDGLLTITGRVKRIIVCKEGIIYHKVFPLLIEDQLSKLPGVYEITVVGRPDEIAGNVLVAYVVAEPQEKTGKIETALREYCASQLQAFERPVEYTWLDTLPRTLIGKVDYRALEAMAKEDAHHA